MANKMALANKKQNLDLFYNMFMTEYETSQRNIEMCKEKAEHIYESFQRQWDTSSDMHSCLVNYDKALTDLSQLSDKLRKFNIQLELDGLKSKEPCDEIFSFPQCELSRYDIGYKSECVISHVKDAKNKLFYITEFGDMAYSDCIIKMNTYFQNDPRIYHETPQDGEVFGLYLEGYMFRAVKENGSSDKFSNFRAFLIDVGEIVPINEYMEMYVLPADCQKLPAQAILCKLEQVNSSTDINLSDYLSRNLYVKHKFQIIDKDSNLLYVKLLTDTNPFRNQLIEGSEGESVKDETLSRQITNPFKRYLCFKPKIDRSPIEISDEINNENLNCVSINESVTSSERSIYENARDNCVEESSEFLNELVNSYDSSGYYGDSRNFLEKTVNSNASIDFYNSVNPVIKNKFDIGNGCESYNQYKNANGFDNLTEEERRILFEEPLNTTNAMKAVMGYDPKDDKRICQFYNPKTKSCFKGSTCQLEHVEKIAEGWTRDEVPTILDIRNQIIFPKVGEYITIIPTHIINVEHFFGQIVRSQARYEPSLKELIYKMSSPDTVLSYRTLKMMPVQFELVIALYTDGLWYRAKILNIIDDDTVKVFYVDYGNSQIISIDDMRMWDRRFEYLPFQAIRCKIAGVAEKRKTAVDAAEQLRKMVLNIATRAHVIDNVEELVLQIWDNYENDVAERLIEQGLAEKKPTSVFNSKQMLPA